MAELKKVEIQLLDPVTGEFLEAVNPLTSAHAVTFTDGKTFQEKLNDGSLRGQQGAQGIQGPKGDTGGQGPQGLKGDTGAQGAQGLQGAQGAKGDTGAQGPQGAQGSKGDVGAQGVKGDKGDSGNPGSKIHNITGTPSTSMGIIGDWAINITNGDVFEKTSSTTWTNRGNIKGPQGLQGAQGPKGDSGIQGPQGAQGPKGDTGAQGVKGDKGDKGTQGLKGDKGDPGDGIKVGATIATAADKKIFFKIVG